jgi:hypothetical protein
MKLMYNWAIRCWQSIYNTQMTEIEVCIIRPQWRSPYFYLMVGYLLFYVPLKNISLIWRRLRTAKFRLMLGAQGPWAGRDPYRATPAATRYLGFSGLIRRTAPFSRLLRHAWGCGGPILTRILAGVFLSENKFMFSRNITSKIFGNSTTCLIIITS